MNERTIVYADKTILKITGLKIHGLKPVELEQAVARQLGSAARLIGVTGQSLELDVYGLPPESVLKDEKGLIRAISMVEGIAAGEVETMAAAQRAVEVDANNIPSHTGGCAGERWKKPE
jgi:hypothetical protein